MTREIYNEKLEMIKELLRLKAKKYDINLDMHHRDDEKILFYKFYRYRGEDEYRGAISVCRFSSFYALNRFLDYDLSKKFGLSKTPFDSRLLIDTMTLAASIKEKEKEDDRYSDLKQEINSLHKKLGTYIHESIENENRFKIKKAISNGPATIVFWTDGTKTVVKTQDEAFDAEKGLAVAIAKRALGDTSAYYDVFKKWVPKIEKERPVEPVKKDFKLACSSASEALSKVADALLKVKAENPAEIVILPCPHCGKKPRFYQYTGSNPTILTYEYEYICGEVGYTFNGTNSTYQGLVNDWNTRVEMIKQDNE